MKKTVFLLFALCAYSINNCVDIHKFTIVKDNFRQEKTFFICNDDWYYTEIRYNTNSNESEIIAEKVPVKDQLIDPLLDIINYLSKDLSERMPLLAPLLDQETKDFLLNKDFMVIDKEFLLDNNFFTRGDIVIYILKKNNDTIELVSRKATLEERKIYIKLKALEYTVMKSTLDAHQSK